jgi:hypothetical protein
MQIDAAGAMTVLHSVDTVRVSRLSTNRILEVRPGDAGPPRLDDHERRDKAAAEFLHHVHDCLAESASQPH